MGMTVYALPSWQVARTTTHRYVAVLATVSGVAPPRPFTCGDRLGLRPRALAPLQN